MSSTNLAASDTNTLAPAVLDKHSPEIHDGHSTAPSVHTFTDGEAHLTTKEETDPTAEPTLLTSSTNTKLASLSSPRKNIMLIVFSIATFIDVCNVSGVAVAVADISADTHLKLSQQVWILTAYSLTFASFLLFAGRLSDVFPAQFVFLGGFTLLGILSLVTSFVTSNKYGFLILRGLGGIAGAMTIPSAYNMIVNMFTDPMEKQKKLALLGLSAALGNVLGLLLAGLTMLSSYKWFFRLVAIICLSFSGIALLILPMGGFKYVPDGIPRWRHLDIFGVIIMAVTLILFILSLTQGPIDGWSSGIFIGPFVVSLLLAPCFFLYEHWVHPRTAVLPSTVWKIKNMVIASIVAMMPIGFWATNQLLYATYWQVVMRWKPIHVAAAMLPQGIAAFIVGGLTQATPAILGYPRVTIPVGSLLVIISLVLMYFSDGGHGTDYWRYCFPAFVIGSSGSIAVFLASGVNLITYCPPEMGGVSGAWSQTMAQIGGAIALGIQAGLEGSHGGGYADWRGNARSFWFVLVGFFVVAAVYVAFYEKPTSITAEHELARERIAVEVARRDEKVKGARGVEEETAE